MRGKREPSTPSPWFYPAVVILGACSGVVGTLAHRMGATSLLPYGLILAFVILAASSYWARANGGVIGLGLHLIGSSGAVWLLMGRGPGGGVLIPISSPAFTNVFDRNAGYIWILGCILLQILVLLLPARWLQSRSESEQDQ